MEDIVSIRETLVKAAIVGLIADMTIEKKSIEQIFEEAFEKLMKQVNREVIL